MTAQASSKFKTDYHHQVLKDLNVKVQIASNPFHIDADHLFAVAARNNTKRSFLFVSKILGKYVPVHPSVSLMMGRLLSLRYLIDTYGISPSSSDMFVETVKQCLAWDMPYPDIHTLEKFPSPQNTVFIGFAETATSLGHSVFSSFTDKCTYIHTTRDKLLGMKTILEFEEEHSHATAHSVYSVDPNLFLNSHKVVMIDDEITTGKTALNMIKAIQKHHPRKEYAILTILDWRSEEDINKYKLAEKELGVKIDVISLISGTVSVDGSTYLDASSYEPKDAIVTPNIRHLVITNNNQINVSSVDSKGQVLEEPYLYYTGRFGISSEDNRAIEVKAKKVGSSLSRIISGEEKTLCLGTGEFLYLPMLISSHMGAGVVFQSTARSPIHLSDRDNYPIFSKYQFNCPYDDGVVQYLYNISYGQYDNLFLFLERNSKPDVIKPLMNALKSLQIPRVYVVTFD